MYKIRKVQFINHPILKNLELNFCGPDGKAVDTIIFAGENGTGKSAIINALYQFSSDCSPGMRLEVEDDNDLLFFAIENPPSPLWEMRIKNEAGENVTIPGGYLCGIFSDVDISFHSNSLSTVTSLDVDSNISSRRSETDFPTQIKQLLIDIQTIDDATLARAYREAQEKGQSTECLRFENRMLRFKNAFSYMFEELSYSRVDTISGQKLIIFQKNGVDIPIDDLSSGEKQVVYRGCFLLQDVNATKGAFVFIDEPEISLHPRWQMKIMEYYKRIFTNEEGKQTSQIFAVTHSPFIIHNENRCNDKVIVLARDKDGNIIVKDKPEYYKCDSIESVQDAFSIGFLAPEKPTVFLEGRTDELYFNKTVEVFGLTIPFQFKWVGYIDAKGQEANTGKDALNKAAAFLISRNYRIKNACLFDCDAKRQIKVENNVITKSLPCFENDRGISIGIENALVFGDIDIEPYKKQKIETDGYGIEKRIPDFQKMACCEYICSLEASQQRNILIHLKSVVEELIKNFGS